MRSVFISAIALLVPSISTPAKAQPETSWTNALAQVERLRAKIRNRSVEHVYVGSMLNEIHVPEHSCSILGRMLGKHRAIHHFEIKYTDGHISKHDI